MSLKSDLEMKFEKEYNPRAVNAVRRSALLSRQKLECWFGKVVGWPFPQRYNMLG